MMTQSELYKAVEKPFVSSTRLGVKSPILVFTDNRFLIVSKKYIPEKSIEITTLTTLEILDGPDTAKWNKIISIATRFNKEGFFDTPGQAGEKAFKKITGKDLYE